MEVLQKGIVTLIRSALTGKFYQLPEDFSLEAACETVRRHQIVTLVYEGAMLCGISRQLPVMRQMFGQYCRVMIRGERQMDAVGKLFAAFDAAGVEYLPVKGCCMKPLYRRPELRTMGDADVLIHVEQYKKIRPILLEQGYTEGVESDHELIWHSDALHLELHKRLIPSYNKDYYRYFGDGWKLAQPGEGCCRQMRPEDSWIYLFTHFAKHYRDGGIGLRHCADLWVWLQTHPHMDRAYICGELEKLQLAVFENNILHLLRNWFEDGPSDEKTEFLGDFIFGSGSWGTGENRVRSAAAKNAAAVGSVAGGRLKRIVNGFFPKLQVMSQRYPLLKKYPVLLPVFWPVRWITAILFRRDSLRKQRESLQIASAENIKTYQQAMQYVGLDFHFKE